MDELVDLGPPDPDYETGPIPGWHRHPHKHPPGSQRDHLPIGEADDHRHYHTPRDAKVVYDHHPTEPAIERPQAEADPAALD